MSKSTVVCALIHRTVDGAPQILVTKRSANLDFLAGAYELPGGHAEEGESHEQALQRELREELNVAVGVGELCDSFEYQTKTENVTEHIYFAKLPSPEVDIQLKHDEIESYRWITRDEVESIVKPTKLPDDPEVDILKKAFMHLRS